MKKRPSSTAGVVAVSLAWAGVTACHHAVAPTMPPPVPALRAVAVTAPTRTDRAWIDSVAESWAAEQPASPESSAVRPAAAHSMGRRVAAPAIASSEATTSATSYAEAAGSVPAGTSAPDDPLPLIIVCAIGATAFMVAVAAGRVAFGR